MPSSAMQSWCAQPWSCTMVGVLDPGTESDSTASIWKSKRHVCALAMRAWIHVGVARRQVDTSHKQRLRYHATAATASVKRLHEI